MTLRAGLLSRVSGQLCFLPEEWVRTLIHRPVVTPMPGSPLGLTLIEGRVVPVLRLSPEPSTASVFCQLPSEGEGEPLLLTGLAVLRVGFFEATPKGVTVDGEEVAVLPLQDLIAGIA